MESRVGRARTSTDDRFKAAVGNAVLLEWVAAGGGMNTLDLTVWVMTHLTNAQQTDGKGSRHKCFDLPGQCRVVQDHQMSGLSDRRRLDGILWEDGGWCAPVPVPELHSTLATESLAGVPVVVGAGLLGKKRRGSGRGNKKPRAKQWGDAGICKRSSVDATGRMQMQWYAVF
ncbi:hypothetical protein LIA77_02532 [Sarocladium implicatum]|nr:hypothetical protein LIA77_02532 [Sarocladium implicatum]